MPDADKLFAVIDTNVIVSSFFSKDGTSFPAQVITAILKDAVTPLYNEEILGEYQKVLSRSKFPFTDAKPTTVEIKISAAQVKYIKTLPPHSSQTLIEETPEYSIYQFHVVPTFDFEQEILSHGPDYEVLSPEWYRNDIKADIVNMLKNYER